MTFPDRLICFGLWFAPESAVGLQTNGNEGIRLMDYPSENTILTPEPQSNYFNISEEWTEALLGFNKLQ